MTAETPVDPTPLEVRVMLVTAMVPASDLVVQASNKIAARRNDACRMVKSMVTKVFSLRISAPKTHSNTDAGHDCDGMLLTLGCFWAARERRA